MKILIEGSPTFGPRSGVGQYVAYLLKALAEVDTQNQYTIFGFLFFGRPKPPQDIIGKNNIRYKFVRILPGRVFNRLRKNHLAPPVDLLLGSSFDVALFTNFTRLPLALTKRSVVIIYDLSFVLYGQYSERRNRVDLAKNVGASIAKSDHVITISESSKQEIIEYYKIDPRKISIISPAVDHAIFYPRSTQEIIGVKSKFNIKNDYILYTGTLEPRKNIAGILAAYEQLPADLQKKTSLVLAGGKGWKDEGIKALVQAAQIKLDVITTGYVADEDLPALYSGALVFAFPSHYEGFGMPPLEAMACGVPVITSDNSSLPEVVGDAGITVAADDTKALTEAMHTVLVDNTKAAHMSKQGLVQAQRFSWAGSGRQLVHLINEVGKK